MIILQNNALMNINKKILLLLFLIPNLVIGDPVTITDDWADNSSYKTNSLYVNGDKISHNNKKLLLNDQVILDLEKLSGNASELDVYANGHQIFIVNKKNSSINYYDLVSNKITHTKKIELSIIENIIFNCKYGSYEMIKQDDDDKYFLLINRPMSERPEKYKTYYYLGGGRTDISYINVNGSELPYDSNKLLIDQDSKFIGELLNLKFLGPNCRLSNKLVINF